MPGLVDDDYYELPLAEAMVQGAPNLRSEEDELYNIFSKIFSKLDPFSRAVGLLGLRYLDIPLPNNNSNAPSLNKLVQTPSSTSKDIMFQALREVKNDLLVEQNSYNFFTPYNRVAEVGSTVGSMLKTPFALAGTLIGTPLNLAGAAFCLAMGLVRLIFSICFAQQHIAACAVLSGTAAVGVVATPLLLPIKVVDLLADFVLQLISLFTRTIATIASCCCCVGLDGEEPDGVESLIGRPV